MGIDSKDISVVVQGPVNNETKDCLQSIRKYLPGATIILSTWEGTDTDGLDADEVVLNAGPGCFSFVIIDGVNIMDNTNRQIVTTKNGLKKVKTKYAIKLRSDNMLIHANFLKEFEKEYKYDSEYKFVEKRILVCGIGSGDPRITKLPYHISDWFYFGFTKDLLSMWDIELKEKEIHMDYFVRNPVKKPVYWCRKWTSRFAPEQYIFSSFLKKHIKFRFEHGMDLHSEDLPFMEKIYVNNLIWFSPDEIGFKFPKYDHKIHNYNNSYTHIHYRHSDWKRLYNKYLKENLPIPFTRDDFHHRRFRIYCKIYYKLICWQDNKLYGMPTIVSFIKHLHKVIA